MKVHAFIGLPHANLTRRDLFLLSFAVLRIHEDLVEQIEFIVCECVGSILHVRQERQSGEADGFVFFTVFVEDRDGEIIRPVFVVLV